MSFIRHRRATSPNKFECRNDHEFEFHNAHCFKIDVPQIGPAQAIYYDVAALKACCEHIKENHIPHPIVYMDRLVDDYVGDKIPLWEKIMDRQGTVCCTWEKTAFEEGLKVGIRLMMEVYSL